MRRRLLKAGDIGHARSTISRPLAASKKRIAPMARWAILVYGLQCNIEMSFKNEMF